LRPGTSKKESKLVLESPLKQIRWWALSPCEIIRDLRGLLRDPDMDWRDQYEAWWWIRLLERANILAPKCSGLYPYSYDSSKFGADADGFLEFMEVLRVAGRKEERMFWVEVSWVQGRTLSVYSGLLFEAMSRARRIQSHPRAVGLILSLNRRPRGHFMAKMLANQLLNLQYL
jgi:hypothetical protein